MAQILLERYDDFTGGLNLRADQFLLARNESPDMLNVEIDLVVVCLVVVLCRELTLLLCRVLGLLTNCMLFMVLRQQLCWRTIQRFIVLLVEIFLRLRIRPETTLL